MKIKVTFNEELEVFSNGTKTDYKIVREDDKFVIEKNGVKSPSRFPTLARAKQVVGVWVRN
ncbi:hypothetical protein PHIM7_66 [Sinorhizobium phage phiM7]|uniref:Uncharacterized protein n=3 Tax=Emdodecavirus TaxID=1980937 RepID=S5MCT7_9CAUD|nr:hypothetical protein AB690_gp072 [Sinorhizobium phage phiM12]YP_009212322.1 hypothetical protein AVT40_gp082 [Sinorhizobium phage phiN3]YP_009601191.1 hypothetical protein FDH46_gp066 [Sinorhizobium phage phiM7]AKF12974.1 hypothetical protein PHIM19_67 [Sinorhizobium phage phiM19]AGR47719.1 hypothetical protein SmphiM12_087 [Sinorhizobium phage phiM12]AKF12614.1 hypothetical protein PHIM7_66 [Sinorhizobium phage phiM7]AKF13346.1 hypothetical protein PHIN3_82 [Sinorhizobium phage phiN3]